MGDSDADSRRAASREFDGGQTQTGEPDTGQADAVETEARDGGLGLSRVAIALVPLVLLALVVGGFVVLQPLSTVESGQALPDVTVSYVTLPDDETLVLHVTNNGPESVTVSQVLVDDAYWNFQVGDGDPGAATLAPLESTEISVPYHWTAGWDLEVVLLLDDGATFAHEIVAPHPRPGTAGGVLSTLALVGLVVGVVPVVLGMLWYPLMRDMKQSHLHAILALAAGVLAFLAFDATFEAFEVAAEIPGAFEGNLLVVTGVVGTLLVVSAISAWLTDGRELSPLGLAYLVAAAIGLHNLAEGLAIGSAFALGRASLGAFLVIGFMVHNVTEGPAVVAPVARERRPSFAHFAALGALAGAPVILGGWLGGLAYSPTLGALFLAVGVGAILQVNWEIASMIRRDGRLATAGTMAGFLVGFVIMYVTDLFVAL